MIRSIGSAHEKYDRNRHDARDDDRADIDTEKRYPYISSEHEIYEYRDECESDDFR